jgi:oligoendopeptidase F
MTALNHRMRQRSLFEAPVRAHADPPVWDLSELYASGRDPAIEADRQSCLRASEEFETEYRGRVALLDQAGMAEALLKLERVHELEGRLLSYAELRFAADTRDPEAGRLHGAALSLASEVRSRVLFFLLEWSALGDDHAGALLRDPSLERFRHVLEQSRLSRPHRLSLAEERILERLSPAGGPAWTSLGDKLLGGMRFGPSGRTLSHVMNDFSSPDRSLRRRAASELSEGVRPHAAVAAHVLSTVAVQRGISDHLRGFRHWMGERVLEDQTGLETVQGLVEQVRLSYDLVRRYYRLKANLLQCPDLMDFDRAAPLGRLPGEPYTWERAGGIVLRAFERCSPELGRVAALFLGRGWIHGAVRPGKRAGAFCNPTVPAAHPYVLMSFGGTAADLLTLGHELGHGIHQYLARGRSILGRVPLPVAEIAALFGEHMVMCQLLEEGGAQERLITQCLRVERVIATTFRQISLHRFECAIHEGAGREAGLGPAQLGELFLDSQRELYGQTLGLSPGHEQWWAVIPHFVHTPGYVYAYAYAQLMVLALHSRWVNDPKGFAPLFERFLSLGGSLGPDELLRPLGLDPRSGEPFRRGLTVFQGFLEAVAQESAAPDPREGA